MKAAPAWVAVALAAYWGIPWWQLVTIGICVTWWAWHEGFDFGVDGAVEWLKRQGGDS